jgi:DnaJ-class molecular chaperone
LPEPIDYYEILDVSQDAPPQVIDEAYRKAAFQHHPDRQPGSISQAGEMMKKINRAKVVLLDPLARREYDNRRAYGSFFTSQGFTQGQREARKQQKKTQHQQRLRRRAERERLAHERARERAREKKERIARLHAQQERARMDRAERGRQVSARPQDEDRARVGEDRSKMEGERKSRTLPPTRKGRKARLERQEALLHSRENRKRQTPPSAKPKGMHEGNEPSLSP